MLSCWCFICRLLVFIVYLIKIAFFLGMLCFQMNHVLYGIVDDVMEPLFLGSD